MSSDRIPFPPQSTFVKEDKPEPVSSKQAIQCWLGPFNEGVIEKPDGLAKITGPCGDSMEISLRVEGNKIIESRFQVDGCAVSRACASMAAALAKGKELEEAWDIDEEQIAVKLERLPEGHRHCCVLARDTLRQAIENYLKDRRQIRGHRQEVLGYK